MSLSLDETLDRLVQAGPVVNTDQGYSMKQYSVSMRNPGTASSLGYLSLLDDFLGTTVQNATAGPDDATLFQRRAFSLDFPRERLPLLTGLLNEKGMTMLQNIESMKEWCGQGQDKQVRPEKVERLNSTSGQEQEETEKATANEPASLTIQPYQSPGSTCEQG